MHAGKLHRRCVQRKSSKPDFEYVNSTEVVSLSQHCCTNIFGIYPLTCWNWPEIDLFPIHTKQLNRRWLHRKSSKIGWPSFNVAPVTLLSQYGSTQISGVSHLTCVNWQEIDLSTSLSSMMVSVGVCYVWLRFLNGSCGRFHLVFRDLFWLFWAQGVPGAPLLCGEVHPLDIY